MARSLFVLVYGDSLMLACLEAALAAQRNLLVRRSAEVNTDHPDLIILDWELKDTLPVYTLRHRFPGTPMLALLASDDRASP